MSNIRSALMRRFGVCSRVAVRVSRLVLLAGLIACAMFGRVRAQTDLTTTLTSLQLQVTEGRLVNVQQSEQLGALTGRLVAIENQNFPTRVAVMESDMTELKWLGRGIASVIVVQLTLSLLGDRRRQHRNFKELKPGLGA